MVLRTARFRPGGGFFRGAAGCVGLALVLALGACDPAIEGWRSVSGADKNDPNPETAPFTGNMAAAADKPYPNLASFAPVPTRAATTAERQKLAQSLIADRNATAAQAGPPTPLPQASPAPGVGAQPEGEAARAALPSSTVRAAPQAAASAASPAQPAGGNGAPAASAAAKLAANSPASGRRQAAEPTPVTQDSTLQMPTISAQPEPEAARPAPPPPALPAVPLPLPPSALPPATVAAATPEPTPPLPVIAPVAPPAAVPAEPKRPAVATTVATLGISGAGGGDEAQIGRVAALYKEQSGTVRVLTYAAAPTGGGDPLDSYRAALDRGEAIAKALADAGIPASKIQTQATPAAGAKAGRVEIQLAP